MCDNGHVLNVYVHVLKLYSNWELTTFFFFTPYIKKIKKEKENKCLRNLSENVPWSYVESNWEIDQNSEPYLNEWGLFVCFN